ncbi:putative quinol monooxygenase [Sphingomonas sp. GlSt437]
MTVLVLGTVRVPPDKVAAARDAMAAMVNASRAEPGCIGYSYAEDVLEPGLIHVVEAWASDEALAAHFQMPHMAQWRAVWPTLGITDRNLTRYNAEEAGAV